MYSVDYSKKAAKALQKLDKRTADIIYAWIDSNLVGCTNPRQYGIALSGAWRGYWRYRVGAYRLIAQIDDGRVKIIVVNAAHRREVYNLRP